MRSLTLVSIPLLALATGANGQSPSAQNRICDRVEVAFTIADSTLVPEGIAHDPVSGSFFVSSTFQRKVVRVDIDGNATDFVAPRAHGLLGAVGMKVDAARRVLWVASSHAGDGMPMIEAGEVTVGTSALHAFDLEGGRLLRSFVLSPNPERYFLNDLVVDSSGSVYVTDTQRSLIVRADLQADSLEIFADLSAVGRPNGIMFDDTGILYASVPEGIARIDPVTRDASLLPAAEGVTWAWADGIVWHDGGIIGIQGSEGSPVRWYGLDPARGRIVSQRSLLDSHPALEQPTTGVIAEGALYVVANSHLQTFRRAYGGERADPMWSATILRICLR
jgi:sugar lactone lactonase YvrE